MEEHSFLRSYDPVKQIVFGDKIEVDSMAQVDNKIELCSNAFDDYRNKSTKERANFLRAIADGLEASGDLLVKLVMNESGLPEGRIKGERGRTCGQLRMFADFIEQGTYCDAVIETADPDRKPIPKADIRRMHQPLGPIVVFTASNFPLAFSTAGGDTASALAGGNTVIVKAHESHPATNKMVSSIIQEAAVKTQMPKGVFQSIYANNYLTGAYIVKHPSIQGGAFTGSHKGGMALLEIANERKSPIPFFAEMGSINPIIIFPKKIEEESQSIAEQIASSVNLGSGQFCTNPGIVFICEDHNTKTFSEHLLSAFQNLSCSVMLNNGIYNNYKSLLNTLVETKKVEWISAHSETEGLLAPPAIATTTADTFLQSPSLQTEVFGPFTLLVRCRDSKELLVCIQKLEGQLTGTIMGTLSEMNDYVTHISTLQSKVGRIIFNGLPTGVEVNHAMHHGGPYPSTTDSRFTSVGSAAINRFLRPVCYQDWPNSMLPLALQKDNPLTIWRTVDGVLTK